MGFGDAPFSEARGNSEPAERELQEKGRSEWNMWIVIYFAIWQRIRTHSAIQNTNTVCDGTHDSHSYHLSQPCLFDARHKVDLEVG